jgi:primosomal protein N'
MIRLRLPRLSLVVVVAATLVASTAAAAIDSSGAVEVQSNEADRPQPESFNTTSAQIDELTVHRAKHWALELVRRLDVVVFVVGGLVMFIVLLRRRKPVPPLDCSHDWDLATPLIRWSQNAVFSIQDSFEHVLISGQTGSGKTSGSFRSIALAALKNGY